MSAVIRNPRVVRQYSHQDRLNAVALYSSLGTLEKASEASNIPLATLHGWTVSKGKKAQNPQQLADSFEQAADLFVSLALKKAKKAAFNHLMTAAGIAVDKMQLLRGQPTSITSDVHREELLVVMQTAIQDLQVSEAIQVRPEPDQSECVNE